MIEPGMVVKFRKGKGPQKRLMTVQTVSTTGVVLCFWFKGKELRRDNYSANQLVRVKETKL